MKLSDTLRIVAFYGLIVATIIVVIGHLITFFL